MEAKAAPRGRPVPVPDETSAGFWAAAARHVFTLARCSACGEMTFPPDVTCPHCLSTEPEFRFEPASGRGRLRTWSTIHRSFLQGFETPYILADVELVDHPEVRIVARLLDCVEAELRIGLPVTVAFEQLREDVAVPAFRLETGA